ncbi:BQ5605_C019g08877 [Microbotryum silenes-dioicae]|uniref:BQ5605_C019g08877 protein n=1 Tax=Microbotryum silenes-dioicae TaxID=796604 RepID=A0A2X0LVW9_9BASI|nr:BQ5605_C019g08877 [Microbotryum silenes-dioicae]
MTLTNIGGPQVSQVPAFEACAGHALSCGIKTLRPSRC